MAEHVVVAVDFSPQWPVLHAAVERLCREGCRRVSLVHVLAEEYGRIPDETHRDHYQAELEAIASGLCSLGGTVQCEVRSGRVAHELLAAAQEHGADLIMLGKRGRNPLADLLLGSVAEAVCREATLPVLLIPTKR